MTCRNSSRRGASSVRGLHAAISLALAFTSLTITTIANATTYQVGPGKPFATLDAVVPQLGPGDIVEVDGNQTYAGGVIVDAIGTSAQKITIRGITINGQRPVFTGGNNTIEAIGRHLVFENIELTAGASRCFYHHGNDITLRGSLVHDCPTHGILGADADSGSLLLEYTEVHHCGGGTQHHQIYIATDETAYPGSTFRMQHCFVHDANGGNNVKSRAERNEIFYNWIEGALYHEIELIGPDGQDPNLAREDSDVVGNVLVKGNTFYVARFGGDGTGETNGRYRFVNNTVITLEGGSSVFRLFDGIESVEMHNNVLFTNGNGAPSVVRQVEAVWTSGSSTIGGSNNWWVNGASAVPMTWINNVQGTDPGFASVATHDLHPIATSDLVDAGNNTTASIPGYPFPNPLALPLFHPPARTIEAPGSAQPRPVDALVDIGAYEYGSGSGGTGGAAGSSGASGSSGSSGTAGTAGTAGSGGTAGASGTSGTAGSAGNAGTGGTSGTSGSAGASGSAGTAGSAGSAGSSGASGAAGAGGTSGSAGAGGASGSAGQSGTSGSSGTSGTAGSSGAAGTGGTSGAAGTAPPASDDDGGCGCRVSASSSSHRSAMIGGLAIALSALRRRATRVRRMRVSTR